MTQYAQYYKHLLEYSNTDDLQILGIVHRNSNKNGQVESVDATDTDIVSPEWRKLESEGNAITWCYVPVIQQLSFFTLIPTQEELHAIQEYLKQRGYVAKRFFVRKDRQRKTGLNEELLTENKKYCAVLLDESSQNKLKKTFKGLIPDNWTIKCHHMTIDPFNECANGIGESVNLMLTHFGRNDKICAVKVVGYKGKTNNAFPHVTIAVNEAAGGKAKDSNKITEWTPISKHITLTGTIENLD
jgi:hypothetical protein